jgi:hypothetical protein
MRNLFILFILLQAFYSSAQDAASEKKFPFQVLYAENTKNKAGQVLKSLDVVSIDDILTVGKNGTLSLIHHSGFPIEVNGDTTIEINDLHDLLVIPKDKNSSSSRPQIDNLFISNSSLVKNKLTACHDCTHDLEILYPPAFAQSGINYKDGLCIKWVASTSKTYQVNIANIFEDLIKSYTVDSNELNVTGDELRTLKGEEKILIIRINDLENKKCSNGSMLKEFPANNVKFPYGCDLEKATFALMAGLYIEMLPGKYFDEAEKYFLLATELSDRPFYKEMLANFKKRTER